MMSSMKNVSSQRNSHWDDADSIFTVGEESLLTIDANGKKKKKKFRKLRKSLSSKRRSLRNLLSERSNRKKEKKHEGKEEDCGNDMKESTAETTLALDSPYCSTDETNNLRSTSTGESSEEYRRDVFNTEPNEIVSPEGDNFSNPLQNIRLLVVDPESGMFEVLQLALIIDETIVNQLLDEIPKNVTGSSLKNLEYVGISRFISNDYIDGDVMSNDQLLSNHGIKDMDLLVAVPTGVEKSLLHNASKSVLSNPQVVSLLAINENNLENESKELSEDFVQSEPTSSSDIVERLEEKVDSKDAPVSFFMNGILLKSLILLISALILSVSAIIDVQRNLTSPLSPGDSMEVGEWRSQCGLLALINDNIRKKHFDCSLNTLYFENDGSLSMYDSKQDDGNLVWQMRSDFDSSAISHPELFIEDNGTILIGGKEARIIYLDEKFGGLFYPWPFEKQQEIFPKSHGQKFQRKFLGIFPMSE